MEKIVQMASRQKLTLEDANNLGGYARDSMDHVVNDAIVPSAKYANAAVTISGTTKVTVATPLRLYRQGRVYGNEVDGGVEVDLISQLPTSGFKKIVALTLTGSAQPDSVEERDFLVNAVTRETQAQPTPTRNIRIATVNVVAGASAVEPVAPAIPAEHLVFAYVTLTPTAVTTVTQVTANRLASLVDVDGRLQIVEEWKEITQPIIDGMRSDIAKLQQASTGNQSRNMQVYLLEQVARLTDKVGINPSAAYSITDWFLDTTNSLVTDPQYVAKVQEGLRFADANSETSSPVLSNPADTRFVVQDGLLLPAYNQVALVSNVGKDSEVALSNSGAQTTTLKSRSVSKSRVRWGNSFTVCTNSAMWQTGRYDPVTNIFTAASGETYTVLDPQVAHINHVPIRLQQFWVDTYEEIYWDVVTTTAAYVGNVCSQTFLSPRAAWLTKVRLGFSRLDTAGDVRIAICRVTDSGSPDPKNTLATVTVPFANLKLYPQLSDIAIPPIYVAAGDRLAVVMITAGNHWLAMAENNKYAQGTFFTSTDGAWFQGDISRDACFEVYAAQFIAPRVVIDLDPLSCSGGMTDLDLLITQIAPDPASITFEVKVNNVWYPVVKPADYTANHPLYGQPASVNARMIFSGTTEVMPGIYLGKTKVTRSRPRTDTTHISTTRTTPTGVTQILMIAVLEKFDVAHHTCTAKVMKGAGFSTEVSPSTTVDETLPDGTIRRTFTWTGLTSLTQYRRKMVIGTDSPLRIFHVANLTDVALA